MMKEELDRLKDKRLLDNYRWAYVGDEEFTWNESEHPDAREKALGKLYELALAGKLGVDGANVRREREYTATLDGKEIRGWEILEDTEFYAEGPDRDLSRDAGQALADATPNWIAEPLFEFMEWLYRQDEFTHEVEVVMDDEDARFKVIYNVFEQWRNQLRKQ